MDTQLLLQIAVVLLVAKLGGEFCQRVLKQPPVLGEMILGILIGKSALGILGDKNPVIDAIAQIGAILLLFEVGLESDLSQMLKVGYRAFAVALVGVLAPLILGYFVTRSLGYASTAAVFVGAALTATSVGITARVFGDLRILQRTECQIVLGAAVIDDVLGLVLLAVVSALAGTAIVSAGQIALEIGSANVLFIAAIFIGMRGVPHILRLANRMETRAAVSTFAMIFCLGMSALAGALKLAPIVGAFAAGLMLARAEHKVHFEEKIRSLADIFIPVFFVAMGAQIDVGTMNPATAQGRLTLEIGGVLIVVAVIGKLMAGWLAPGKGLNRWLIGIGMIPRGEVGLIFANLGLSTRIIQSATYSAIVLVVIVTTLMTPLLLRLVANPNSPNKTQKANGTEPLANSA